MKHLKRDITMMIHLDTSKLYGFKLLNNPVIKPQSSSALAAKIGDKVGDTKTLGNNVIAPKVGQKTSS